MASIRKKTACGRRKCAAANSARHQSHFTREQTQLLGPGSKDRGPSKTIQCQLGSGNADNWSTVRGLLFDSALALGSRSTGLGPRQDGSVTPC